MTNRVLDRRGNVDDTVGMRGPASRKTVSHMMRKQHPPRDLQCRRRSKCPPRNALHTVLLSMQWCWHGSGTTAREKHTRCTSEELSGPEVAQNIPRKSNVHSTVDRSAACAYVGRACPVLQKLQKNRLLRQQGLHKRGCAPFSMPRHSVQSERLTPQDESVQDLCTTLPKLPQWWHSQLFS